MPTRLNYRHLHYFWLIAKEGSVARASEKLELAPQTVSGQIATLEQEIGLRLFRRNGRQLVLTDAGQEVFRHAEKVFSAGADLEAFLAGEQTARRPQLSVGITASIHKLFAYRTIQKALDAEPALRLRCRTGSPGDLLQALRTGQLHVVLTDRIPETPAQEAWQLHTLERSPISLFGTKELARQLRPGFPHSLQDAPYLANALDAPYHQQLMLWLQQHGIRVREIAEIDDSALLKVFGHSGLGLFAAPSVITEDVCRQYQVELVGELSAVEDQLFAVTRSGALFHPGVSALCAV
ncbi:MAG: LysR family transcriptional regulator [Natronospirillum sp.]|uniref:LysR family transcriptional regulator n=1 Tax=Natronospirillum sp. TaxID=2812955 RepID=UPI0025D81B0C|nr:LysR family transcriptional regulator [Natronospirillum sp.]MCH8550337.1 LysR family transcriptional regulator [Natronospirillum sp.]